MEKYEITIITKEPFDTAHGKDTKDTPVKKEIESLGGKILNVQSLGQKQMAYQIKKETAGFYTVITLEIDPTKVLELNKKFGLKQEILRHLILVAKAAKTEVPRVRKEVVETKTITPEVEEKPKEEIPEPLQEPVEDEGKVGPRPISSGLKEPEQVAEKIAEKPKDLSKKDIKPTPKVKAVKEGIEEPKEVGPIPISPVPKEPKVSPATKELEEESLSTEERLKALDKKLDELLKE